MMLEVQEVDKIFRSGFWMTPVQVLHGVSLQVPDKTVFGFVGANGAGKTSLIQLIVGIRKPTRGSIRVCGYDADSREARKRIGYLPERPYFYEHLSGKELLAYFGTLSGMQPRLMGDRIVEVLKVVGLAGAGDKELKNYSKGMLQRIGIAQAILHEPELLILDEPMSGLDPIGRKEIRELIQELARRGHTVFFSTHIIPDVEAVCDQVALIRQGKIIGSGQIDELIHQYVSGGTSRGAEIFCALPPSGALAQLAQWPEIREVQPLKRQLKLLIKDASQSNDVLKKLLEAGIAVQSLAPVRPSLEALFDEPASGGQAQ